MMTRHNDGERREGDRMLGAWLRRVKPTEILAWLGVCALLMTGIGWQYLPTSRLVATLDARVTRAEKIIDTLRMQQSFTNYLQCVSLRTDHPELLPPDCQPIIASRRRQ